MQAEDIMGLLPIGPLYPFIHRRMLANLRLVREDVLRTRTIDFQDLPRGLRELLQEGETFSGFHAPLMEQWGVGAHFISVYGQILPNRRYVLSSPEYPALTSKEVSFEMVVEDDVHWIWAGGWRNTPLTSNRADCRLQPQTNYRAPDGHWRRVAAGTILLGPERKPHCPLCGAGCLRPDHWWKSPEGLVGKGRKPNPFVSTRAAAVSEPESE